MTITKKSSLTSSAGLDDKDLWFLLKCWAIFIIEHFKNVLQADFFTIFHFNRAFLSVGHKGNKATANIIFTFIESITK